MVGTYVCRCFYTPTSAKYRLIEKKTASFICVSVYMVKSHNPGLLAMVEQLFSILFIATKLAGKPTCS
uniref:Uncharacterized protein n=1 Tax=Nelumbo nucifera TaxID=4432 RepID=A0A822ZMB1_NELNU|nr:TPA_asm: hypothetical protein HUJ06_002846 [Nelumbo nucifera]